ncbi:tRNA (32-2'-O)-methyltransferase regulator THADA isoform X1 [Dermacentor andersoni]|uniref:tRNA (32-2'-O)-methyltransferase regulator THADA isoform X1 n=1 Tax=Dermacentor andersoni TaxID=34620 RepID=UPI0024173131|nr:thyroid adenoma-associated protein homolog isoform X1 [Dermacentor andersoni]
METNEVKVCFDFLYNIFSGPASGVESLQTKIRSVINETVKQPKLGLSSLPLSSLLVDLLEHITDQGAKQDTLLLAGTCVVRILCRFLTLEAACDAVRELLIVPSHASALKSYNDRFLPSLRSPPHTVDTLSCPTFYHLCLIHGVLSAGPDAHSLLTCQRDGAKVPLILEVLRPLIILVHNDRISRYHSVSTLQLWFKTLEHLLRKSEAGDKDGAIAVKSLMKSLFTPESDAAALVLSAVDANWESSVNGVSDLIKRIYQSFLNVTHYEDLTEMEKTMLGTSSHDIIPRFHKFLLERTMQLDWKEKPKYLSLACLLQFVSFESCLKIDADFPIHSIRGLLANHLVSATVDVYRASLTFGSTQMASKEMWSVYWKAPIVDIIRCDDGTCLQNMTTHLLPWTLKNIPGSLEELAESFETYGRDDMSLSFLATLGRIAVQTGLTSVVLEKSLMAQCLVHQSNAIRIEAFSLCCSSYILRAGRPEADLLDILQFVKANLNVDDSWFRSRLVVQLENVFVALRESVVSEFNKASRQKQRHSQTVTLEKHYTSAFCFVRKIIAVAVQNLFPGANYQRAITSLLVLESLGKTFRADPSGKQRSTHKADTLEKFFASEMGRFELEPMHKSIKAAFLKALFHNVLEVRLCAFRLLTTDGCPMFQRGSNLQDALQDAAHKYLASPRPQDNAIGALFLRLYLTNLKKEPKQLATKLEEICSLGEKAFSAFQHDPVSASASFPLHGVLFSLVTCLSDVKCILAAVQGCSTDGNNSPICSILNRALCLAKSSLLRSLLVMVPKSKQHILGATTTSSANRAAPSFEDTNLAFAELIRDYEIATGIRFTPEELHQIEERLASFCWNCIKNSCLLLDLVANVSLRDNGISYPLDSRSLHDIADALVAVMTGCRHRGAIESCCESLKSLCQVLSSSTTTEISDIPFDLVRKALSSLTSRSKSSSVTRRSAGLPLLIRALLEGEARNVKRSMSWTVDYLSCVIGECTEQCDISASTVDLPQAEALHVLCAVVGSASLTAAVMMHLGRILWFCFEGLASPFWVVRNAAQQLYGVTAPRVLGLKKTREEFVGHDALSALDLFAKFPDLRVLFLNKLDGSNVNNHDLYFVLDFLSRLKPLAIGQQGLKSLEPFRQRIRNHLGCRSWKLRLLAAKCISSFCQSTHEEVMLLLANVVALEGVNSCNSVHAHLYAVNRLLRNNPLCVLGIAKWFQESDGFSKLSWTLSSNFFVRIEFLDLLDLLSNNGDCTECQEKLQKSFMLDIADTPSRKKLPGYAMWKQRQTKWFLRRAAHLCPPEIVTVLRRGMTCDVIMESTLEFLFRQAQQPDSRITSNLWCEVAVALVTYLNGAPGLPTHSADVFDLLEVLLHKQEVTNRCVNLTWLTTFQRIAVETSSVAGTTVRALSLTMWSHCLKHCLENLDRCSLDIERSVESWISAIASAVSNQARLAATADICRMHAAHSLHIAGDAVFTWAAYKCRPRKAKHLQSLFSTTLELLQDEDPQVRSEAAGALPLPSVQPQSLPVQPNVAANNLFRKLVLALEGDAPELVKFLWCELCRSGPSALSEFQQLVNPTVASLFEQDESGVFIEPMVVSQMLHQGTRMALEAALQCGADVTSFLLDETTRLVDELKATSQALDEFALHTDKPLGSNLEILGRPKLHHAIAVLQARADLLEWACVQFSTEQSPGAFAEMVLPGKEGREQSLLPRAALQLSHTKAHLVDMWTRLTFTK